MAPTRAPTTTVNMCNELIQFASEVLAAESCASPTPMLAEEENKLKRVVEGGCGHHDSMESSYHAYHAEGGRRLHTKMRQQAARHQEFLCCIWYFNMLGLVFADVAFDDLRCCKIPLRWLVLYSIFRCIQRF
jgi:hypothetical protein